MTASTQGPLRGIRVLDLSRLVPGPYGSLLLADLGADVIVVLGGRAGAPNPAMRRGKREITLDLKSEAGRAALHAMMPEIDVILEGFRPGVADRLGAGYEELAAINPGLIYCSLTGYGSSGPLAQTAGHDINYLALTGVLGALGPAGQPPRPPFNILADLAGGGLLAAFGITAALVERARSGRGQAIEASMVDGVNSLAVMVHREFGARHIPPGGDGLMDGGAPFYCCYETLDGRYVAVGAIEDGFFRTLWTTLGFDEPVPAHMDPDRWPEFREQFAEVFKTRTRDEWAQIFADKDACVTPVLDPDEAQRHPHSSARGAFDDERMPAPVPRFSRTPGRPGPLPTGDQTAAVLRELGVDSELIAAATQAGAGAPSDGLAIWPPY